MARRKANAPLNVFLNGRLVGLLRREATGAIDFKYDNKWLGWEHGFPVSLSLPLREDRYIGTPVINVFDNLLPDNEPIRKRVAERVGAGGTDAYSLLTAIGHDCVGALQFLSDGADPGTVGQVDGKPVADGEIGEIINNLASAPLGVGKMRIFASRSPARRRRPPCFVSTANGSSLPAQLRPPISSNRRSDSFPTGSTSRIASRTSISALSCWRVLASRPRMWRSLISEGAVP